jgi:hypothetical protein
MFVSGFTIARNVVRADYPLKEAVYSILPLCDEFVIAVGKSEDNTLEFVQSFDDPKIRIIETVWDDNLREGGRVLADETNKAKAAVSKRADWLFYIQADECLHEKYHSRIHKCMLENLSNSQVDGLLFDYVHFYGSYDYIGDSRKWYRKEIRVVRNNPDISLDEKGLMSSGPKFGLISLTFFNIQITERNFRASIGSILHNRATDTICATSNKYMLIF